VGEVIGEVLPLAVAVSISPVQIIAVILLLVGPRPRANATAFVAGFLLGVGAVLWLLTALAGTQDLARGSEGSTLASILRILLGVLLLVAAARKLRARPGSDEPATMPSWMDGMERFQPPRAALAGAAIGAVNPKIVAMSFAAAVTVAGASLPGGEQALVLALYLLVAMIGVSAPLVVVLVTGERSGAILDTWKAWLTRNGSVVMAVLFAVFGVVFIGNGIQGL
jgi:threonine/homoserine/homoserine lactone efflux protein